MAQAPDAPTRVAAAATPALPPYTIKTYRYLRLSMVVVLVLLGSAVAIEHVHTISGCWQPSISDYYYTPVQAVFVAALVSIGVCMIVLKGSTGTEDLLLNLAGMLAPVVAFVPTPQDGTCSSVREAVPDIPANVANNVPALFAAGLVGLATVAVVARVDRTRIPGTGASAKVLGVAGALALLLAAFAWFLWGRASFIDWAHYGAAFPMFGAIVAVAVLNAYLSTTERTGRSDIRAVVRSSYFVLALLMVLLPVAEWLVSRFVEWRHVALWAETTVLVLFAAFWVLQTRELWYIGVRRRPE